MYYAESSNLISSNILDKAALEVLDREIAHVYADGGKGNIEMSLLIHKSGVNATDLARLMSLYETAGVVRGYQSVSCPCGQHYDPGDGKCLICGDPLSAATANGETVYNVLVQPEEPAYDPNAQPAHPKVFISYRRGDAKKLATDIYYFLKARGVPIFLDNGEIPVGANAEQVFLRVASEAEYFIVLVSEHYFESEYCKKEIAHSARSRRRVIRVNIPPVPTAPADMPWVNTPNWNPRNGNGSGLDSALQTSLLSAIQTPTTAPNADLRQEACIFLMEQLSFSEIDVLWNRLQWMANILPANSKPQRIGQIRQEITASRVQDLCNALAP